MAIWRTTTTTPSAPLAPPVPDSTVRDDHFFRAWTEDLYISGFLLGAARLSDILNASEPSGRIDRDPALASATPCPHSPSPRATDLRASRRALGRGRVARPPP